MSIYGTFISTNTLINLGETIYKLLLNVLDVLEESGLDIILEPLSYIVEAVFCIFDVIETILNGEINENDSVDI